MTGVTWVAIAALALSVVSLGWQIGSAIFRRGRIEVGLQQATSFDLDFDTLKVRGTNSVSFFVTVANPGASALTIYDAGLFNPAENVSYSLRAMQAGERNGARAGEPPFYKGPDLPVEVPAHGVVEWELLDHLTKDNGNEARYHAYAERYRASRGPKRVVTKQGSTRLIEVD